MRAADEAHLHGRMVEQEQPHDVRQRRAAEILRYAEREKHSAAVLPELTLHVVGEAEAPQQIDPGVANGMTAKPDRP